VLEASHLVTHVRRGNRSLYRIDAAGLQTLRDYLDGFWTDVLDSFATYAQTRDATRTDPPDPPDPRSSS
jgi:hypothetical protein